jgi:hypothetical protein
MKRLLFATVLVVFAFPMAAHAFVNNVSLSVGEGIAVVDGKVHRGPVNFEFIPSFSIPFVKFDLGLVVTSEKPVDFQIRPGVRVTPPWLYVRAAIPLKVTHGFDYGFLLGVGKDLFSIGIASIFLEVDSFWTKHRGFDNLPVEGRLGVSLGF